MSRTRSSLLVPKPASDQPGTLEFSGSPEAELFTRQVAESFAGVLHANLVKTAADGCPPGFVRSSVPPSPGSDTMGTRDAGTLLRELVAWGYFEHACLVARCLMDGVGRNAEGFLAYPEKLEPGRPEAGDEIDGTAAVIIGLILLRRHLQAGHLFSREIYHFLHQTGSPARYLLQQVKRHGLIAGTGEFGPGTGLPGACCNVVQNSVAMLALLAMAGSEENANDPALAIEYRHAAASLSESLRKAMLYRDGSWVWAVDARTLKPNQKLLSAPVNCGTGRLNGVAAVYADVLGLDPLAADWPLAVHCLKTFERLHRAPLRRAQFTRHGFWPQWDPPYRGGLAGSPSHGDGFALQTMLLYDRLDLADQSLRWLIRAADEAPPQPAYQLPRTSRHHFYERTYSPDAMGKVELEAGDGALHLASVTEPLKVARLMLGVDPAARETVVIMPRLPAAVSRIEARRWPLLTERGAIRADLTVKRDAIGGLKLTCDVIGRTVIPELQVRLPTSGGHRTASFPRVSHLTVSSGQLEALPG